MSPFYALQFERRRALGQQAVSLGQEGRERDGGHIDVAGGAAYKRCMTQHLLKLCVGADSIADLEGWIGARMALQQARGQQPEQAHTTRMVPRRVAELLDGGSLFWVIRGQIAARQTLLAIRPFTDGDGIGRCDLVLEPVVRPVQLRPCRPFQGWRYLAADAAPGDIDALPAGAMAMPEELRRELRSLGLL